MAGLLKLNAFGIQNYWEEVIEEFIVFFFKIHSRYMIIISLKMLLSKDIDIERKQ